MRLSLRTSITLAIAVPLVAGVAGVAIATTSRAAAERQADLDVAARAAALTSYAAFADDRYTVDFGGGPGPAPDVTASLVAWRVLPGGDGAPLFVGGAFALPDEAVPDATAEEVGLADWPRPWRVAHTAMNTSTRAPWGVPRLTDEPSRGIRGVKVWSSDVRVRRRYAASARMPIRRSQGKGRRPCPA